MLKALFNIKHEKNHTVYNIFGIRLKVKYKFDRNLYNKFISHLIKPKTVLIIELNDCHWETMPGLCKYFLELGYNVDLLTRSPAEKIFDNINSPSVNVFECKNKTFDKIFRTFDFSKYERIIYNSKIVYFHKKGFDKYEFDLSEYYDNIPKGIRENIYLQHHIERYYESPNDKQIILANPSGDKNLENCVVNAHYFKDDVLIGQHKNETVNFISIGELSQKRRNSSLLINAVKSLNEKGIDNFKVTIIGNGELSEVPVDTRKYFHILGRVDYQTMFNEIEKSDFILTLLDPDLEDHKRYMNCGTSGTFQLVYGFLRPCLIHKTFGDIYGFDSSNSLIYESNDTMYQSMINAINMSNEDYVKIQNNLKNIVLEIEHKSKNSLMNYILTD